MTPNREEWQCIGIGSLAELESQAQQIAMLWGRRYVMRVSPASGIEGTAELFLAHAEPERSTISSTSQTEVPHVHVVYNADSPSRGT